LLEILKLMYEKLKLEDELDCVKVTWKEHRWWQSLQTKWFGGYKVAICSERETLIFSHQQITPFKASFITNQALLGLFLQWVRNDRDWY
jgi:hypothetical protein